MKRAILAVVLVSFIALPVSVCFAANQKNMGCGLGTLIMKGNDGLLFQVLRRYNQMGHVETRHSASHPVHWIAKSRLGSQALR